MKIRLIIAMLITTTCLAQTENRTAELQTALAEYQTEYTEYVERIRALIDQLKIMDADIEESIAKTLDFAKRYTDSADTRERIMKFKKSIIKDLIGSIERHHDLQKELTREIALDRTYLKDDAIALYEWADGKITLRIQQITELTASLGGYDFYSRGIAYDDDNYDYEREKQLAEEAVKNKKEMIQEMRKGIENLRERSARLEKELANVHSNRSVDEINLELKTVNEKITLLEESVDEIFEAEASGQRVGKNASREIEKELRTRVNEIKSSSESFIKSFDALLRLLRMQRSIAINIEKYEFALEQLNATE